MRCPKRARIYTESFFFFLSYTISKLIFIRVKRDHKDDKTQSQIIVAFSVLELETMWLR